MVKFINYNRSKILESLDGKNVEAILSDLGVKIHRTIYEHFQQFQFNIVGKIMVNKVTQIKLVF